MVLFNDTQPPKPPTLFGKIMTWLIRLTILCFFLVAFFIGSLNLLQGNSDTQKGGIEKSIAAIMGKETIISTLHTFELFPEFILDFDGLKSGVFDDHKINVSHILFRAPGAILFKRDGVFRDVDITDIGFLNKQDIVRHIQSISIVEEEELSPYLVIQSSKPTDATLTFSLEVIGIGRDGKNYKFKDNFPFSLEWSGGSIKGNFFKHEKKLYVTGSGKAPLPSLLPFLNTKNNRIDCFLGNITFHDYKFYFRDVILKTNMDLVPRNMPGLILDLFSPQIQTSEEETTALDVSPQLLAKSACPS